MKAKFKTSNVSVFKAMIGLQLVFFAGYAAIGAWSVDCILSWFNKDIPLIGDLVIGVIAGAITIPVSIIGFILKLFGIF